ncbi:hypothetical protein [Mesorhizobium sp. M0843]|uniref:hypothetical protein n=1 Tax=Mesorhizobium sp. M0843 TaxID=2957010 RepID=UPI00333DF6D1
MLNQLAKTDLLILDDWGPEKLNDDQRRDVLEIMEGCYERPESSRVSRLRIASTRSLQTQLWPMPSWTASFTTPVASISPAKTRENSARQKRLKQP